MILKEQITNLIETGNDEDIYTFLRKLSKEEKKEITTTIKKLCKKYEDKNRDLFYGKRHRALIAGFVCLSKREMSRAMWGLSSFAISDDIITNILPWYVPTWYSDAINEDIPWSLEYTTVLTLQEKGILAPSKKLIAIRLSKLPKKYNKKEIQQFLEKEITLKEHIWYLFEEGETEIDYGYYNDNAWEKLFVYFSKNKHIDRERLLIAIINTSNKGFNKNLSGWWVKLLESLKPSKSEILHLQQHFFSTLNCPQSKWINTTLKLFKSVCIDKNFEHKTFIENTIPLLNSEIKSIVSSTLMILDKIAKLHADTRSNICLHTTEVLLNPDEKLQHRASKILIKYGDPAELSDTISMYVDGLYQSTKELLVDFGDFTEEVAEEDEPFEIETLSLLEEEIPVHETFDEILFFVNQSLEYNQVYDTELALDYLPKLALLIDEDNLSKLEPTLKRAYDKVLDSWGAQFEYLLATYIYEYGQILIEQYPDILKNYTDYQYEKTRNNETIDTLETIKLRDEIYTLYHERQKLSFSFLKKKQTMPLLSIPTHAPCWIEPKAFLQKVLLWEEKKEAIQYCDWQIALARIPLELDTTDLKPLIKKVKNKELQQVLNYNFGFEPLDIKNIKDPYWWLQSILNKQLPDDLEILKKNMDNSQLCRELGAYDWKHTMQDVIIERYDHNVKKCVDQVETYRVLKIDVPHIKKKEEPAPATDLKSKLKEKFKPEPKIVEPLKNIYDKIHYLPGHLWGTPIMEDDEKRLLTFTPNTPTAFLMTATNCSLQTSDLDSNDNKRIIASLQQTLHEIWQQKNYPEPVYIFLGASMLSNGKTARAFSAETWIKANSENNMDNALLGKVLGKLEIEEYAGLKRFTDLIISNMLHISKHHDTALIELLEHMIPAMNTKAIKGAKKLLELFFELKQGVPTHVISSKVLEMLEHWAKTKSLKSIINKIIK